MMLRKEMNMRLDAVLVQVDVALSMQPNLPTNGSTSPSVSSAKCWGSRARFQLKSRRPMQSKRSKLLTYIIHRDDVKVRDVV